MLINAHNLKIKTSTKWTNFPNFKLPWFETLFSARKQCRKFKTPWTDKTLSVFSLCFVVSPCPPWFFSFRPSGPHKLWQHGWMHRIQRQCARVRWIQSWKASDLQTRIPNGKLQFMTEILWNIMKYYEILWNIMKYYEIICRFMIHGDVYVCI